MTARKIFASGSPAGALFMTSAVYDDPTNGSTVLHFPVPLTADGVKILDNWRTLGMRATGSNDILLDNVFVADTAIGLRRPAGKWAPFFHLVAMIALPLVYAVYVGIAEVARDLALREAEKKRNSPDVQSLVGAMENELSAAQIALESMIEIAAKSQPGPETTNKILIRRTLAGQSSIKTVEKAVEVVGGASFFRSLGIERLFRDVQAARFHPLQEKPQLRYTGRLMLGLDINE